MDNPKSEPIKTIFPLTYFYAKDQSDRIRKWGVAGSIKYPNSSVDCMGVIKFYHGVVNGTTQEDIEYVHEGLQSRDIEEQVLSRINSRINNKKKAGYVDSIEDAKNNQRVNLLGMKRPMLAKKFKDFAHKIDWKRGVYVQPKLNGERCIFNIDDDLKTMYSRQGILFENLDHIKEQINHLDDGISLDGELYCHGVKLQTINSWVKRKQPSTLKVQYHVYDVIMDGSYTKRKSYLESLFCKNGFQENFFLVPSFVVTSEDEAFWYRDMFMKDGYEGAMIRQNENVGYQDGKRSNNLLKMKKAMDEEFLVVDISPSVHGWGILECVTKEGKIFSVSAPGSIEEKTEIYFNREKFIGRYCQVEFFEWTIEKKPFHPVALRFRDIAKE